MTVPVVVRSSCVIIWKYKNKYRVHVSDLALLYGMAKSVICSFLKCKETVKTADVAKGLFGKC